MKNDSHHTAPEGTDVIASMPRFDSPVVLTLAVSFVVRAFARVFVVALVLSLALPIGGVGLTASAQSNVIVNIVPPPLNQLTIADLWKLQVTNLGRTDIPVFFAGSVTEERDGMVADGETSVVILRPGLNVLSGRNVEPVDVGYGSSKYERALVRTGGVPAGVYEICVSAVHQETGVELSVACITHEVSILNPPVLISPAGGDVVTQALPLFVWIPQSGGRDSPSRTRIVITPVYGRQSRLAAILSNLAWYEGSARGTVFQYPASAKKFEEGLYAWRVVAVDPVTLTDIAESDVEFFRWEPELKNEVTLAEEKIPGIPNAITDELLAPCSGMGGATPEKDIITTTEAPTRLIRRSNLQDLN